MTTHGLANHCLTIRLIPSLMTATAPCTSASKLLNGVGVVTPSPSNPSGFLHSLILTSLAAAKGIEPLSSGSEPDILSLYTTRPF